MNAKRCIALWLVCAAAAVGGDAVERQVKGVGATRTLAVRNALAEAVGQVQGVVVRSGVAESGVFVGNMDVTREEAKKSIELEGISARGVDSITITQAEGLVKSYEVISEQQVSDDVYEVMLKVWVYDYSSPLATQKTPVAVGTFIAEQTACPFGDVVLAGDVVARQFTDVLTGQLVASGKFSMLDRAYAEAFAREKAIWKSEDGGMAEKAKIGNVQGAEYLLVGRLRRVGIYARPRAIPATGQESVTQEGHFVAEARLFVAPTRQIVYTGEYRLRLEDADVRNLVEKWEIEKIDYDELKDRLLELGARRIVEDLLEQLYPVRIAVAQPELLVVDQGAGRVADGDIYTVVGGGAEVRDPQTGELLGQAESQLATVRITQSLPRFAYAQVVDGSAEAIAVGQVCRYVRPKFDLASDAARTGRKDKTEKTPDGGVKLPFDK